MSNLNLDTSPYFDDFDANKDYYKVLFKPGFPVQARELTTLQSILQNQVEKFGRHFFNEGAMVIPGGVSFNSQYESVQINPQQGGVDVLTYISGSVGKNVVGATTGVRAKIVNYIVPPAEGIVNITLFLVYSDSGVNGEAQFSDNEPLLLEEALQVRSGATIPQNGTLATTFNLNASATGSAFSISEGVYFAKGTFIQVKEQSIILDPYGNGDEYRVGLQLEESIVTATQDNTLYDNAKGFNNFSAPGADRFEITATLTKKLLSDTDDNGEFIELSRFVEGEPETPAEGVDARIFDILAKRTFDESGNYSVDGFGINLDECLNNLEGNNGVYNLTQTTADGNTPSDDLFCVKVDPGTAYVLGYDTTRDTTTIIDVEKPRTTESSQPNVVVPFQMGNLLNVDTVTGTPLVGLNENSNLVGFYTKRKIDGVDPLSDDLVGEARVYSFSLEDSAYVGDETPWNLYLYDVQFYSKITLNVAPGTKIAADYVVRGLSSNAFGYVVSVSDTEVTLSQVSGTFFSKEVISINGSSVDSFTISNVETFSASDIASVFQNTTSLDPTIQSNFAANTVRFSFVPYNFLASDIFTITSGGVITSPGKVFSTFRPNQLISYQDPSKSFSTLNVVSEISDDGFSMTVAAVEDVSGLISGSLPSADINATLRTTISRIVNVEESDLYVPLEKSDISYVQLSNSSLAFSAQITSQTVTDGVLTANISQLNVPTASFMPFDQERYSVVYSDGTIAPLQSNQVVVAGTTVEFSGLANGSNVTVNVTATKNTIRSKTKVTNRSNVLDIDLTASTNEANGLTSNPYYGLRVEDEEISLNVPDVYRVLAVYESTNSDAPTLDQAEFPASSAIAANTIIGERMIGSQSKAVARVVLSTASTVDFVSLNGESFIEGENVLFEESSLLVEYLGFTVGNYRDITPRYELDAGQRSQFYDYSRIRRQTNSSPSKKLRIIFDSYTVPSNDNGDFYTVNSYSENRYARSIATLPKGFRATDTLDFRPRVADFNSTTASPFAFSSRQFANAGSTPNLVVAPNDGITLSYDYYLGRMDLVVMTKASELLVLKGTPSTTPTTPNAPNASMTLAVISLPPYLYSASDASISYVDNRRYTMRDIGNIADRVSNLEELTSLNLLEQSTASLQVLDADGNSRFKSGFFADPFTTDNLIDLEDQAVGVQNEPTGNGALIVSRTIDTLPLFPDLDSSIDQNTADYSQNLALRDSNTRKTGDLITLDYDEVKWISQEQSSFEINVNPFELVLYTGILDVVPNDIEFSITRKVNITNTSVYAGWIWMGGRTSFSSSNTETSPTSELPFVSERNLYFAARLLRPRTEYYTFVDNQEGISVIPKLLEIEMVSGVFETGEVFVQSSSSAPVDTQRRNNWGQTTTCWGWNPYYNRQQNQSRSPSATPTKFTGRVAAPNHKFGSFDSPDEIYLKNPYDGSKILPAVYGATATVLNIDTRSLVANTNASNREVNSRFGGRLDVGDVITGQSSGAVARIKQIRLVSDEVGDVIGAYYIPEGNPLPEDKQISTTKGTPYFSPYFKRGWGLYGYGFGYGGWYGLPATSLKYGGRYYGGRWWDGSNRTGRKTPSEVSDRLESNPQSQRPAFTLRTGTRTFRLTSSEENKLETGIPISYADTNITSKGTYRTVTTTTNTRRIVAPGGVYNTINTISRRSLDPLAQTFKVDGSGAFLTSIDIFFSAKSQTDNIIVEIRGTLLGTPTDRAVSRFATVVVPPSQIKISGDASVPTNIVFPSPIYLEADITYAVVVLAPTTNEYLLWAGKMLETANETGAIISKQYINGSFFKSQNGSIWTPDQEADMKFTLYKAKFSSDPATVFLNNTPLVSSRAELNDPILTLPRKILAPVTGTFDYVIGSTIAASTVDNPTTIKCEGVVEALGGPSASLDVLEGGSNYLTGTYNSVPTVNINANGDGMTLNVTAIGGTISNVVIDSPGTGYGIGDVVGLSTAQMGASGGDSLITVATIGDTDTLFLTRVSGEKIENTDIISVKTGDVLTGTGDTATADSNAYDPLYDGDVLSLYIYNHGMQSDSNVITIGGVTPDGIESLTTQAISIDSNVIILDDDTQFATFEGEPTVEGYLSIEGEIIKYSYPGDGTLGVLERGVDGTPITIHSIGAAVQKYEISGVSLRRINTIINFPANQLLGNLRSIDTVLLRFDRGDRASGSRLLSFNQEQSIGGSNVNASKNIQFSEIQPSISLDVPENTSAITKLTAISGTSSGGNEQSFQNLGDIPIENGDANELQVPLLVSSDINVASNLVPIGIRHGLTLTTEISTTDPNLSPVIDTTRCIASLIRTRLNNPINNYAEDPRVKFNTGDPHSAIYVSKVVDLNSPATSLKVLTTAYRDQTADIRVLYKLYGVDSTGATEPTWELFPGFANMLDTNSDGFGDTIVDTSKNNGLPNRRVRPSLEDEYLEYEYEVTDLPEFGSFQIKIVFSGTNESRSPILDNIRAIALS